MENNKEVIAEARNAMTKSIMKLMRKKELAFDTSIVLNMPREFNSDPELKMKVKGTKLLVNPEWFLSLSDNDRQWNIRHTAWHVIGFDEPRGKNKDANCWNLASDLWINSMLEHDDSFDCKMPPETAYDPRFRNWSKDKIYEYLKNNQQEQEKQQGNDPMAGDCGGDQQGDQPEGNQPNSGNGDGDNDKDGQGQPQPTPEQLEKQIQSMVQQAAMQAKQAGGKVPDSIEEYLDELYNPKLNWANLLMRYMTAHNTYDYSYQRLHKKFFPHGIIMPSMYSEGLGPVVVATDESCSVSDDDLLLYKGAIEAILTEMEPESMTVLGFTTQVDHETVLTDASEIDKIKFRVHGGTHIPAVFDYIEDRGINPQVLICFSDMESAFPKETPAYDVIWICVGNPRWQPPFGRVVYVESK